MIDSDRRRLLAAVGSTGALLGAGAVGTAAARGGRRKGASAENTVFELVEANDDFEKLESALETTGLDAVLDAEDDQFTVFGPTDAAFDAIDTSGLSVAELTDVLLYHVTEGRRYAPSVVNAPEIEMLNGDTVAVDGTTLNGGQAEIVTTDIEALNGVVHVIDGVLLP